jgi:hypothetical protein
MQAPSTQEVQMLTYPNSRDIENACILKFKEEMTNKYRDHINWLMCDILKKRDLDMEELSAKIATDQSELLVYTYKSVLFTPEAKRMDQDSLEAIFSLRGNDGIIHIGEKITIDQLVCDTFFPEELCKAYGQIFGLKFTPISYETFDTCIVYTRGIFLVCNYKPSPTPFPYELYKIKPNFDRYRHPGDASDRSMEKYVGMC